MNPYQKVSEIFDAIRAPARLQIVLAIGTGEACVCHLEAALGMRQAYISQQLMVLREKGLISSRRQGKFIYYSLREPELMDLIFRAALLAGVAKDRLEVNHRSECECPTCS